jgi:cell division protein FtsB
MIVFFTGTLIGRVLASVLVVLSAYAGFRIWLSAHDDNLLSGYVLQSEKTALQAQLDEVKRQKNAAAQSLEEYRKRNDATQKLKEEADARLEKLIAEDSGSDGCTWGDSDIEWLRKH